MLSIGEKCISLEAFKTESKESFEQYGEGLITNDKNVFINI